MRWILMWSELEFISFFSLNRVWACWLPLISMPYSKQKVNKNLQNRKENITRFTYSKYVLHFTYSNSILTYSKYVYRIWVRKTKYVHRIWVCKTKYAYRIQVHRMSNTLKIKQFVKQKYVYRSARKSRFDLYSYIYLSISVSVSLGDHGRDVLVGQVLAEPAQDGLELRRRYEPVAVLVEEPERVADLLLEPGQRDLRGHEGDEAVQVDGPAVVRRGRRDAHLFEHVGSFVRRRVVAEGAEHRPQVLCCDCSCDIYGHEWVCISAYIWRSNWITNTLQCPVNVRASLHGLRMSKPSVLLVLPIALFEMKIKSSEPHLYL